MVEEGRRIAEEGSTRSPHQHSGGRSAENSRFGGFHPRRNPVLAVVTLGSSSDEQKIEALGGETFKSFMLHYNFPAFSVGEVRPLPGPGRREIRHGALAERSVKAVLPKDGEFPYTIRVVSEVLESNGSSSMATVCGSSLALMDAGVPITEPVGGIAMGLVKEGDKIIVLSDILGDEDTWAIWISRSRAANGASLSRWT